MNKLRHDRNKRRKGRKSHPTIYRAMLTHILNGDYLNREAARL
ncbi:MAG: hypothetical protein WCS17_11115 [Prevotella sp.]